MKNMMLRRRLPARSRRRLAALAMVMMALAVTGSSARAELPPAPPQDDQAEAQLLESAGDGFKIHAARHFLIAYDTDVQEVRDLTARLTGTYNTIWKFCEALDLGMQAPTESLRIILYGDFDAYGEQCQLLNADPNMMAGFYEHNSNLAMFSSTSSRPEMKNVRLQIERLEHEIKQLSGNHDAGSRNQKRFKVRQLNSLRAQLKRYTKHFNQFIVRHEAAHQVLFNIGVHRRRADNPQWLVEGLATQFEIDQTQKNGKLRRTNHPRLADLRSALGLTDPRARRITEDAWRMALKSRRVIPLRELIGGETLFQREPEMASLRYAQSWALVYYLDREHTEAFAEYVRALINRDPRRNYPPEAELEMFESVFGEVTEDFERDWLDFMVSRYFSEKKAQL